MPRVPARRSYRLAAWVAGACALAACIAADLPAAEKIEFTALPYKVIPQVIHQQLDKGFCWFHPRAAALPGYGKDGAPAVIVTLQKHLVADDHYSGMWTMRSDDLGKSWTGPQEIPELAWQPGKNNETIAVCDATPGWHAKTGKYVLIGTQLRYSAAGAQLLDEPGSHAFAYAVYDPKSDQWTKWQSVELPDVNTTFFVTAPGCVQWLVKDDGSLLVPVYMTQRDQTDYSATVLHCKFDGAKITYQSHGDVLAMKGNRGYCEPSLVRFGTKYYLTLRNDAGADYCVSDDGLHFSKPRPWKFDDGKELGSYNTQAHWLAHSEGLFLCYTRRGANNDHIARNRAPLFIAQVDPVNLVVVRSTEQELLPERGVMLGNFGASPITANESWVTDAEFIATGQKHPRGADGSVWIARVLWSKPNGAVEAEK